MLIFQTILLLLIIFSGPCLLLLSTWSVSKKGTQFKVFIVDEVVSMLELLWMVVIKVTSYRGLTLILIVFYFSRLIADYLPYIFILMLLVPSTSTGWIMPI